MNASPSYVLRYKWGALAALVITLLSLMPQLRFWIVRGSHWNGAYTILQLDEVLYSAYVSALIDGRPRRNDPVSGRDDHPEAPLPESLFSIQFVPAYAIALPARVLGISASTAFIVLMGAAGLLASLSVWWLLTSIMGDGKFAAIGMLAVLCFGALAAGQGLNWIIVKSGREVSWLAVSQRLRTLRAVSLILHVLRAGLEGIYNYFKENRLHQCPSGGCDI